MEVSHIHIVINHVPLLGTAFGLILLISGLIFKNKSLEKVGLITFVVIGLATIGTYFSGKKAIGPIKEIAGTSREAIHEHSDMAETALYLMLGLMLASLTVLIVQWRSKTRKTGPMNGIVIVLAITTFVFMSIVNNLGGKVRRPELREEAIKNDKNSGDNKNEKSKSEDDDKDGIRNDGKERFVK